MTEIDARVNPEQASDEIQKFLAGQQREREPIPAPVPPTPEDNIVNLPCGLVNALEGTVVRTAEVRELDGADEEALARVSNNVAKYLDTLLDRGVAKIGTEAATSESLSLLLAGDRDALVVAIRRVTFGDDIDLTLDCPLCGEKQEVEVLCSRDIPSRSLENPLFETSFSLTLKSGTQVEVNLPTGEVQKALASSPDFGNEAALNTLLLSKCISKINGLPVISPTQARNLKVRERREILEEIEKRNPGPRLREVTRPCSECGGDMPLPFGLVDLFLV